MNPFERINVEETFDAFVRSIGSVVLKDQLESSPSFNNADYVFHDLKLVAELKCLENDKLNDPNYMHKIETAWLKWKRKGLIKSNIPPEKIILNTLPKQCACELMAIASHFLKGPVKKANKQIRETKRELGISNYKGLLLLANDGNYAWPPETLKSLACRLLYNGYSSIDNIVIFSVNLVAEIPGVEIPCRLWMPSGRSTSEAETLKTLAHRWFDFHDKLIGQKNRRFGDI